jgi:hypothetical protein
MRKALKITGWSFGGILLAVGAFVALLVFPGALFAHKLEYRNFTVYSQQQLDGMSSILRNVESRLSTSPIYDPSLEQNIFFGYDNGKISHGSKMNAGISSHCDMTASGNPS